MSKKEYLLSPYDFIRQIWGLGMKRAHNVRLLVHPLYNMDSGQPARKGHRDP